MQSTLAARISALMQLMLGQSGWLRSELRNLDRVGHGHRRMREICDQLDSLDSSIVWDLRDELENLTDCATPPSQRIVDWLRTDIEPLVDLICCLDRECPSHPLVSAAMIACGDIVGGFRQIEHMLMPPTHSPHADLAAARHSTIRAAEPPRLC